MEFWSDWGDIAYELCEESGLRESLCDNFQEYVEEVLEAGTSNYMFQFSTMGDFMPQMDEPDRSWSFSHEAPYDERGRRTLKEALEWMKESGEIRQDKIVEKITEITKPWIEDLGQVALSSSSMMERLQNMAQEDYGYPGNWDMDAEQDVDSSFEKDEL